MPMTAFLLQDIPAEVADYASRVARSTRRDMNAVLVEMLSRAAATPAMAPSSAPALAAVASAPALPDALNGSTHAPAATTAPALTFADDGSSESLALLEAMQAAQSIPRG